MPPLKLKEVWAIRVRLQLASNRRDLALFNLAIDSKLSGSDLAKMKVSDISNAGIVSARAMVLQQKTGRTVQFEITEQPREAISEWMTYAKLFNASYLFPIRLTDSKHLSTRQYARIMDYPNRAGLQCIRDSIDASYKTDADLQAHEKPSVVSVAFRPYEAGKHGPASWY